MKKYYLIIRLVAIVLLLAISLVACLNYTSVPTDREEKLEYKQKIMHIIEDGLKNHQEKIDISEFRCDRETLDEIITLVFFSDPLHSSYLYPHQVVFGRGLCIKYLIPVYDNQDKMQFVAAEIEKISSAIDDMSELDKVIWINNYICSNYDYDHMLTKRNIYNMLNFGEGVCSAYVQFFKLLADAVGLESSFAISYEMKHAWNIVRVDGYWYNIDVTWNDQNSIYCYLLSDEAMLAFHMGMRSIEETIQFVKCTDTRYDKVRLYKKDEE